jgi:asparagine synthase (glutamine-hydrolysing)
MAIDLLDYLPNDGLAKVDVAATARGLAVRSPMLDPQVVTLARRMPWDVRWRRRAGRLPEGKRVLREAFADLLPPAVARRGKAGFGVPVSRWLAGPYADWARDVLLDTGARTADLLRRDAVAALLTAHTARRADHGERLWALLCLELWMAAVGL